MTAPDPCPRCGSACEAVSGPVPDRWGVRCIECGLWADDREGTEAEAIAAWNRRALPARGVGVKPWPQEEIAPGVYADVDPESLAALAPTDAAQARVAALREAAEIARDFEANGVCGIQRCTGGMILKQILALIGEART